MAPSLTTVRSSTPVSLPDADVEERQRSLANFRGFYVKHADFVRRVVARLLGPNGDIEDAVQEVFLVALRKRAGFAGRAAASTWLYARLRRFLGLDAAPEPSSGETPQQIFEHRESSERLYGLLERISDKKRTVFVLHELENLPGEEIARIVDCPLKTVWTRLHHARRELRLLAAELDDGGRP